MNSARRIFGLALAAMVLTGGAAQAQGVVDERFLSASCTGAAFSCAFTVQQTIAQLRQSGVVGPALDRQVGRIAAIVAQQVSPATPAAARARIAEALNIAAANASEPAQQEVIRVAAQNIATSSEGTAVSLPPLDTSPA